MRILQVSNRIPFPLNEGGTIGIYNYTKGFAEQNCAVTLLAQAAQKHNIDLVEASSELSKYAQFEYYPVDTDVKIFPAFFNLFGRKSYNVERFRSQSFETAIVETLESHQFDIIQIEGTFPALYSEVILKHKKSAKVVLRQHNVEYQIWQRLASNARNPIKKWYFNLLSKRLKSFESQHLNQFDAVVPVTEDDGELFRKLGCVKPIYPSPAGININYWFPAPELENPSHIYHIGSLEWIPNVEALQWFLNDVWPKILKAEPKLKLFVAGKGMPDSIKNLQIENVDMVGEVEDAASFIQDKAISVVPLKSGSGIRLKILEAMAAGKAVVSTTIGAQGINYTDGNNLVIADTPDAFAAAVVALNQDSKKRVVIQDNARLLIEDEYSNERVVQKLLEFYKSL